MDVCDLAALTCDLSEDHSEASAILQHNKNSWSWSDLPADAVLRCLLTNPTARHAAEVLKQAGACCDALHQQHNETATTLLAALLHLTLKTCAAHQASSATSQAASTTTKSKKSKKMAQPASCDRLLTRQQAQTCAESLGACFAVLYRLAQAADAPEMPSLLKLTAQCFTNLANICAQLGVNNDVIKAACAPALRLCLAARCTSANSPATWLHAAAASAAVNGLLARASHQLFTDLLCSDTEGHCEWEAAHQPGGCPPRLALAAELRGRVYDLAEAVPSSGKRTDARHVDTAGQKEQLAGLLSTVSAQLDAHLLLAIAPPEVLATLAAHPSAAMRKAAITCCKQAHATLSLETFGAGAAAPATEAQQPEHDAEASESRLVPESDTVCPAQLSDQPSSRSGSRGAATSSAGAAPKVKRLLCKIAAHAASADGDAMVRKHACASAADMLLQLLSQFERDRCQGHSPVSTIADAELLLNCIGARPSDSSKLVRQEACKALAAMCQTASEIPPSSAEVVCILPFAASCACARACNSAFM